MRFQNVLRIGEKVINLLITACVRVFTVRFSPWNNFQPLLSSVGSLAALCQPPSLTMYRGACQNTGGRCRKNCIDSQVAGAYRITRFSCDAEKKWQNKTQRVSFFGGLFQFPRCGCEIDLNPAHTHPTLYIVITVGRGDDASSWWGWLF